MGQTPQGSATTMHAVREAIQRSQASLAQLGRELGSEEDQKTIQCILFPPNSETVAKWRKRAKVEDLKTGPKEPRSTILTEAEEAMDVAFQRHTCCRWTTAFMLCSHPCRS